MKWNTWSVLGPRLGKNIPNKRYFWDNWKNLNTDVLNDST